MEHKNEKPDSDGIFSSSMSRLLRTGKLISSAGKGAAAGPGGAILSSLWENRKTVSSVVLIITAFILLILIYIQMLPPLIFGIYGLDQVPAGILNDNSLILQNIADTENRIEFILREKHDAVITEIEKEIQQQDDSCECIVIDEFADQIIYESTLIISQFCASQDNFHDIHIGQLEDLLERYTDNIFFYTVEEHLREETIPETGKTRAIHVFTYTVHYEGDSYFEDHVFHLNADQKNVAFQYAFNLNLFLYDNVYQVVTNPDLVPGIIGVQAVDLAMTKLGIPYSQELRNQEGYFDCSSFTYWIYRQLGISLQYDGVNTAAAQGRYIVENDLAIAYEDLAPGDLIFYTFGINNRYMNIGHVAVYAGNGYVVDASSTQKETVYRPIYNTGNIVLCGRPYY